MYYDIMNKVFVSGPELARRGLPRADPEKLAEYGFYLVDIQPVEYDPDRQALEPAGEPEPSETIPLLYIQKMRAVDLLAGFKREKLAALAAKRWERQTAGFWFADLFVATAPEDQDRLATAIQSMKAGGIAKADFKFASGWERLELAELEEIAGDIGWYVQDCYSHERELSGKIMAASGISELNGIDLESGWPSNDYLREE